MRISEVMTRDVATLAPEATAFDAARLMWDRDCGFIPIGRIMSRSVISCSAHESFERTHARLRSHQLHRLPVVDERGRLVGVVSLNDLARHAVRQHASASAVERSAVAETLGLVNTPRGTALTL